MPEILPLISLFSHPTLALRQRSRQICTLFTQSTVVFIFPANVFLDPADVDFDSIVSGESGSSEEVLEKARKYAKRLSADIAYARQVHVFVNGNH